MLLKDLLRFRNVWLGIAMIWIVLFHIPIEWPIKVLDFIINLGYAGVDICLFASGIGCYYSLTSNSDVGVFIKRRLNRIMPMYLIFIVAWLGLKFFMGEFGYKMAIGNIFAVQLLTLQGDEFNWYISAILLFYFLAPYFKMVVDRTSVVFKSLFFVFLIVVTIPFWEVRPLIIIVTRLAIFYIGMLFARDCKNSVKISKTHIFITILTLLAGVLMLGFFFEYFPGKYRWPYGLYWYPFILITPPLCVIISYISLLLEKCKITKVLLRLLDLCGSYSFEIYLLHIALITIITKLIEKMNFEKTNLVIWLVGFATLIIGCFILRRITDLCEKIYKKAVSKKQIN